MGGGAFPGGLLMTEEGGRFEIGGLGEATGLGGLPPAAGAGLGGLLTGRMGRGGRLMTGPALHACSTATAAIRRSGKAFIFD